MIFSFSRAWVVSAIFFAGCVPTAIVDAGHPLTQQVKQSIKSGKATFDHSVFNKLLKKHVKGTRLDYKAIKSEHALLKGYLQKLKEARVGMLSRNESFAFLMNAYNAYTIHLMLENYPIASIKKINNAWTREICNIGGTLVSLNFIEHQLLRPQSLYNDPRMHFAVNCAAIGCPPIRNHAFTGKKVQQQLEAAVRTALSKPTWLQVKDGKVQVTEILNWYGIDFKKKHGSLAKFLMPYVKGEAQSLLKKNGDAAISFLKYDWQINDVPKK